MTGKKDITFAKDVSYVLDGGALIHRIPWVCGKAFGSILKLYTDYVLTHYGKATVVFDGYENASTKDIVHMRRSKGKKGVSVSFSLEMNLTITKEVFLNESKNKQKSVTLLREELQKNGCSVF